MASSVYSVRMFGGFVPGGATADLAVVPVGVVWIVRSVTIRNDNAGDASAAYILVGGGTETTPITGFSSLASKAVFRDELRQVLNSGDAIRMVIGAEALQVMLSGYELST